MFIAKKIILFYLILFASTSCNEDQKDSVERDRINKYIKGNNELARVLDHYKEPRDSLKLRAAYFLIDNMRFHQYSDISIYDSAFSLIKDISNSESVTKKALLCAIVDSVNRSSGSITVIGIKSDLNEITATLLIENIEYAFLAWQEPWAKKLQFQEFCEYLLPYKVPHDKPFSLRKRLYERYMGLDNFHGQHSSLKNVCKSVHKDINTWFVMEMNSNSSFPYGVTGDNLFKAKIGFTCRDGANAVIYSMRSIGIAVVNDFVPNWANRSMGHEWTAVVYPDNKFIPFTFDPDAYPGMYKVAGLDSMFKNKCPKVYRRTFAVQKSSLPFQIKRDEEIPLFFNDVFFKDVTNDYVSVSNIEIVCNELSWSNQHHLYLCVFDNQNWQAVAWGNRKYNKILFKNVGRDVVYLPAWYIEGRYVPAADPFLLTKDGIIHSYTVTSKVRSANLLRKYPIDESNTIKVGERYELRYWNKGWISLGKIEATTKMLRFSNVPSNSLLLLHNLDRGKQERIFSLAEDGRQIWW